MKMSVDKYTNLVYKVINTEWDCALCTYVLVDIEGIFVRIAVIQFEVCTTSTLFSSLEYNHYEMTFRFHIIIFLQKPGLNVSSI